MLSKREQTERRKIVRNALASERLEGLEPDAHAMAGSKKWARGEIEIAEVIADFANRVKRGEIRR